MFQNGAQAVIRTGCRRTACSLAASTRPEERIRFGQVQDAEAGSVTHLVWFALQNRSYDLCRGGEAKLAPNPAHAEDWAAFIQCCEVADSQDADPTAGATHYFSMEIPPPSWADPEKQTATIGRFRFYKR